MQEAPSVQVIAPLQEQHELRRVFHRFHALFFVLLMLCPAQFATFLMAKDVAYDLFTKDIATMIVEFFTWKIITLSIIAVLAVIVLLITHREFLFASVMTAYRYAWLYGPVTMSHRLFVYMRDEHDLEFHSISPGFIAGFCYLSIILRREMRIDWKKHLSVFVSMVTLCVALVHHCHELGEDMAVLGGLRLCVIVPACILYGHFIRPVVALEFYQAIEGMSDHHAAEMLHTYQEEGLLGEVLSLVDDTYQLVSRLMHRLTHYMVMSIRALVTTSPIESTAFVVGFCATILYAFDADVEEWL